jgi:hypothetical protein
MSTLSVAGDKRSNNNIPLLNAVDQETALTFEKNPQGDKYRFSDFHRFSIFSIRLRYHLL